MHNPRMDGVMEYHLINHPEGTKRFSCFYDLKYWVHNTIHHLLDPMLIMKNVCHSLISHLLGEEESAKAWTDLKACNLKKEFWKHEDGSYKVGSWVHNKSEQKAFVVPKSIKAPTGYGVDLRNAINKKDHFISFKTQDFPYCMMGVLRKLISKNFW
jgi:hypothetical protein